MHDQHVSEKVLRRNVVEDDGLSAGDGLAIEFDLEACLRHHLICDRGGGASGGVADLDQGDCAVAGQLCDFRDEAHPGREGVKPEEFIREEKAVAHPLVSQQLGPRGRLGQFGLAVGSALAESSRSNWRAVGGMCPLTGLHPARAIAASRAGNGVILAMEDLSVVACVGSRRSGDARPRWGSAWTKRLLV